MENHLITGELGLALGGEQDTPSKISFDQTVCALGRVGLGTKNACEFRFTNTGQGPLIITSVKSTCGCTVAQLEKKEYAPGESGTIKATYTAPNTTTTTQKSIYVSSNDKTNPSVRLTIKARARRGRVDFRFTIDDLGFFEIATPVRYSQ
jgi:hypothetical protein